VKLVKQMVKNVGDFDSKCVSRQCKEINAEKITITLVFKEKNQFFVEYYQKINFVEYWSKSRNK
jgi:hypothetical protein